jgi:nicotinamide-nucleotide amidase
MHAEVISIGSELAAGVSLDTNSQWIARELEQIGLVVRFHTTVADDLDANESALRIASERADVVVVTGGLGPTQDDLTRDALARLTELPLVEDGPSLERIAAIFQMFNRPMPERNRVQAMFPQGAVVIPNNNGTAPGIWLDWNDAVFVCLPGVPREMKPMFEEWVLPRLKQRFPGLGVVVHKTLRCFGAGESQIEEMLGDMTRRGRTPEVGITASEATISLRVTARAPTREEAEGLIQPDVDFIRQTLGSLVFGEDDEQLHTAVAKALLEHDVTVSTAESCTGGMVGELLTETPGISRCYLGGVVAYSNQAKLDLLDVPGRILDAHGAVSQECAEAMAVGCRERFHSDLAVSVTGIAGPDGGTPEKPVGLVYAALAHPGGVKTRQFKWGNDRRSTRIRAAKMALNLVRLYLLRGE